MDHPPQPAVLVVDDEPDLADLYAAWLSPDYSVETAYSGDAALQAVDETVDVVLLDRRMPGRSGDEVLAEIRDRGLECRVAMVTAVEPDFDVLELGFDEYLVKPVTREDLDEVVTTLLARKRHHDSIQQYYRLVSKRALLETQFEADVTEHEEFEALQADIASVKADLDEAMAELSDADFVAQLHRVGRWSADDGDPKRGAR